MRHEDWMGQRFRELSLSLGFQFLPPLEAKERASKVLVQMEGEGIEAFLVIQKMDRYYLCGTTQDSILFLCCGKKPLLMVKREMERAKVEAPLDNIVELRSLRDLPGIVRDYCGRLPQTLGLELDVLPVREYLFYEQLVPETRMFSIGAMPKKFADAYRACREFHDSVLEGIRPGRDCEELFLKTLPLARELGYEDSYLGPSGLQTRFVER